MKILQVSVGYPPYIGGVEEHVRNISERLAKKHNVTIFVTDASGKLPRQEEINGVLVRSFLSFNHRNLLSIPKSEWQNCLERNETLQCFNNHSGS